MKKTLFLFLILMLIFLASCDYAPPLPPLSDRIGVYQNVALNYTITIPPSAESVDIKVPKLKEDGTYEIDEAGDIVYDNLYISTFGPDDMRLDYYSSTGLMRVVIDAQNFNTLYMYTNMVKDDKNYGTCTK